MFRVFCRPVWQKNPDWPEGYEPYTRSMDNCQTLQRFDNRNEAMDYCHLKNAKWRKHSAKVRNNNASPNQRRVYYEASRYEWTEEA